MHRLPFAAIALGVLAGCAALPPPGADAPRTPSVALQRSDQTALGTRWNGALRAHPGLAGMLEFLRYAEFVFTAPRLTYRMHNKLMVADNARGGHR